jgi:hypothetical protein
MKKTIVFLIGFFIGLLILWQYQLYQTLSQKNLSCGGDWSYQTHCPIGSSCQSTRKGPLAGSLCKPLLLPLFSLFKKTSKKYQFEQFTSPTPKLISPTPIQTMTATIERIISSEVTVEDCKIKVETTKREIFLETNFLEADPQRKCYQSLLNKVSPSGQYVVFEDVSGGIDSALRIFFIRT